VLFIVYFCLALVKRNVHAVYMCNTVLRNRLGGFYVKSLLTKHYYLRAGTLMYDRAMPFPRPQCFLACFYS